jgi:hypothetical protein
MHGTTVEKKIKFRFSQTVATPATLLQIDFELRISVANLLAFTLSEII